MNTKAKPIVSWSIWAFTMSIVLGGVTFRHLAIGWSEDDSYMSILITLLFLFGFVASGYAALKLHHEWGLLEHLKLDGDMPPDDGKNGLATIFNRFKINKGKNEDSNIDVVIDAYHSQHNSRVRTVSIIASLCISMGLLGTVIGLIIAIQGLGGMVNEIGVSQVGMMAKLKEVVSGMGTAFYTTFYGALAGLILRAVAVSQLNSLTELCAMASEYADKAFTVKHDSKEEALSKQASKMIETFTIMQKEIEMVTARIASSVDASMASFGELLNQAGQRTIDTTEQTFKAMASKVEILGGEVGTAFAEFNSNVEASGTEVQASISGLSDSIGGVSASIGEISGGLSSAFADINYTIGKSGEELGGAFGQLNSGIENAGEQISASLSEFNGSIDDSSREVEEAARELRKSMKQVADDIRVMSEDKLEKEAEQMAGQLSLAAAQFSAMLKKKPEAPIPNIVSNNDDDIDDSVLLEGDDAIELDDEVII